MAAVTMASRLPAGQPARRGPAGRLARRHRLPAFAAGLGIQTAFAAGMQGFFLTFALWLQIGEHFSPLKAGLTSVAFSVGSFIGAPAAVPLAQRYGRRVLAGVTARG
jgi:predicted MFS family arabinose efflux permease